MRRSFALSRSPIFASSVSGEGKTSRKLRSEVINFPFHRSSMSSPRKKSIREARLEKIERLLEEHEKSTFTFLLPSSSSSSPSNVALCVMLRPLCSSSDGIFALCNAKRKERKKMQKNCAFNLEKREWVRERVSERNKAADSINTNQYARYVAQVASIIVENRESNHYFFEWETINLCYNLWTRRESETEICTPL